MEICFVYILRTFFAHFSFHFWKFSTNIKCFIKLQNITLVIVQLPISNHYKIVCRQNCVVVIVEYSYKHLIRFLSYHSNIVGQTFAEQRDWCQNKSFFHVINISSISTFSEAHFIYLSTFSFFFWGTSQPLSLEYLIWILSFNLFSSYL